MRLKDFRIIDDNYGYSGGLYQWLHGDRWHYPVQCVDSTGSSSFRNNDTSEFTKARLRKQKREFDNFIYSITKNL